jgi:hypothetical protein
MLSNGPTAATNCVQHVMRLFRMYNPPLYHMMKPSPCSILQALEQFCAREGMLSAAAVLHRFERASTLSTLLRITAY